MRLRDSLAMFDDDHEEWIRSSPFAGNMDAVPLSMISVGKGSHGTVYTDLVHAYKVVKIPSKRSGPALHVLRNALHEAVMLNSLGHTSVLQSTQTTCITKRGRIRMIVHRLPLAVSSLTRRCRSMTMDDIRNLLSAIAVSLAEMHSSGVCHGDIKPDNILSIGGKYRLCDLSISCLVGLSCSRPLGSFYYRPPEIFAGQEYTPASDMWSLGVVLLDCLYGQQFFRDVVAIDSCSDAQLRRLSVSGKALGISGNFGDLLTGLLCRDPRRRLTATDVLAHPFCQGGMSGINHDHWGAFHPEFDTIVADSTRKLMTVVQKFGDATGAGDLKRDIVIPALSFIFLGRSLPKLDSVVYHFLALVHWAVNLNSRQIC